MTQYSAWDVMRSQEESPDCNQGRTSNRQVFSLEPRRCFRAPASILATLQPPEADAESVLQAPTAVLHVQRRIEMSALLFGIP